MHLYTALDNGLFDKYGLKLDNIFIRGSAQNLAALSGDEVQFTYCAADGTIPGLATGIDAKLVASPLVKLPYVLVARKEIRRDRGPQGGKPMGIARAGGLERPAFARSREKIRHGSGRGHNPPYWRQPG